MFEPEDFDLEKAVKLIDNYNLTAFSRKVVEWKLSGWEQDKEKIRVFKLLRRENGADPTSFTSQPGFSRRLNNRTMFDLRQWLTSLRQCDPVWFDDGN